MRKAKTKTDTMTEELGAEDLAKEARSILENAVFRKTMDDLRNGAAQACLSAGTDEEILKAHGDYVALARIEKALTDTIRAVAMTEQRGGENREFLKTRSNTTAKRRTRKAAEL